MLSIIILLITVNNRTKNSAKNNIFTTEKINMVTDLSMKEKDAVDQLCKDNGVFLLDSQERNVIYLIFDDTHVNLNGEAPYFSDVRVETKDDMLMIYFNEESKKYLSGKYPELKQVYKIIKDKDYTYIRVFKNGEETHFDGIGV